jgi:hypothetical protein
MRSFFAGYPSPDVFVNDKKTPSNSIFRGCALIEKYGTDTYIRLLSKLALELVWKACNTKPQGMIVIRQQVARDMLARDTDMSPSQFSLFKPS